MILAYFVLRSPLVTINLVHCIFPHFISNSLPPPSTPHTHTFLQLPSRFPILLLPFCQLSSHSLLAFCSLFFLAFFAPIFAPRFPSLFPPIYSLYLLPNLSPFLLFFFSLSLSPVVVCPMIPTGYRRVRLVDLLTVFLDFKKVRGNIICHVFFVHLYCACCVVSCSVVLCCSVLYSALR